MNLLISLFDYSGVWSKPYKGNGWIVWQIDIKHGTDVLSWNYRKQFSEIDKAIEVIGILAAVPCTDYALSGAKYFAAKDADGRTEKSNLLCDKAKEIIEYFSGYNLKFWCVENPMTRIHKLNPWLGDVKFKFNPCDFALYSENHRENRYNKQTWLFGKFNSPVKNGLSPLMTGQQWKDSRRGTGAKRVENRSITPDGFAKAFYQYNH